MAKKTTGARRPAGAVRPTKSAAKPSRAKSRASNGKRPSTPLVSEPTHEQIAERAYYLSLARGGQGSPLDDWFRAEQELRGGA